MPSTPGTDLIIHRLCAAAKAWLQGDASALATERIEVQAASETLQAPVLLISCPDAPPVFAGEPIYRGQLSIAYHYEADAQVPEGEPGPVDHARALMAAVEARMADPGFVAAAAAAPHDVVISYIEAPTVSFSVLENCHAATWSTNIVMG